MSGRVWPPLTHLCDPNQWLRLAPLLVCHLLWSRALKLEVGEFYVKRNGSADTPQLKNDAQTLRELGLVGPWHTACIAWPCPSFVPVHSTLFVSVHSLCCHH